MREMGSLTGFETEAGGRWVSKTEHVTRVGRDAPRVAVARFDRPSLATGGSQPGPGIDPLWRLAIRAGVIDAVRKAAYSESDAKAAIEWLRL